MKRVPTRKPVTREEFIQDAKVGMPWEGADERVIAMYNNKWPKESRNK